MNCIRALVKNFILRSDMFAASPNLRIHGQPAYETYFGGCFSILLVVAFAAIFGTAFIQVLNKVHVTASLNIEDNPYDETEITGVRFAVGIKDLDFGVNQSRYFNILLNTTAAPQGGSPVQLSIQLDPCIQDDWKDLGTNFQKLFGAYDMTKMLCPSASAGLKLRGFSGSLQFQTISIMVEQCRNGTSPHWNCTSPADTKQKFQDVLSKKDFFKVELLLLNTVISPQQENATKLVLQNEIFLTFSNTSGSRGQIKMGRYSITTDNSIWPNQDEVTEEGYYIAEKSTYSMNLYSTHYVKIEIEKARTIYTVQRVHDKIDQMLSYVGGLFALLFAFIFFWIGSYNQYKYEITVAEHGFCLDQSGQKVRQDKFGFHTYLGYAFYDWIKSFGINIKWQRMKDIDNAREEINQQMDVKYLIKRIQKIEGINRLILGERNLILTCLSKPPNLDEVRRMRKIMQYYDKVIKVQNEQSDLKEMFKITNANLNHVGTTHELRSHQSLKVDTIKDQKEKGIRVEDESYLQLDSEDEEIEQQIFQIYRDSMHGQKNDEVETRIVNEVSLGMRHRLQRVKDKIEEGRLKSQLKLEPTGEMNASLQSYNQNQFIASIMGAKSGKRANK